MTLPKKTLMQSLGFAKTITPSNRMKESLPETSVLLLPAITENANTNSPSALIQNQNWVKGQLKTAADVITSRGSDIDQKVSALSLGSVNFNDFRLGSMPIIIPCANDAGANAIILTDNETYVNQYGADMLVRSYSEISADRYLMSRVILSNNFSVTNAGTLGPFNPAPPVAAGYYGIAFSSNAIPTQLICTHLYLRPINILDGGTSATIYIAGMNLPIVIKPFENQQEFAVTLYSGRPTRSSSLSADGFGLSSFEVSEDQRSFTMFYDEYTLNAPTNPVGPTVIYTAGPNIGNDVQHCPFIIATNNCIVEAQFQLLSAEMTPVHLASIRATGPFS